jgi:hypothetical protein
MLSDQGNSKNQSTNDPFTETDYLPNSEFPVYLPKTSWSSGVSKISVSRGSAADCTHGPDLRQFARLKSSDSINLASTGVNRPTHSSRSFLADDRQLVLNQLREQRGDPADREFLLHTQRRARLQFRGRAAHHQLHGLRLHTKVFGFLIPVG